ncbi:hypothetical protein NJ76_15520, partial [Rhodococcus sp. IITR03]
DRGRIAVVVGAGGDRDRTKRRSWARSRRGRRVVVVTDDNPRTENPAAIRVSLSSTVHTPSRRPNAARSSRSRPRRGDRRRGRVGPPG